MKSFLAVLILSLSFSTFGMEVFAGSALVTLSPTFLSQTSTNGFNICKVIADQIEEYNQNGQLSAELQALVTTLQKDNPNLSQNEAVDVIQSLLEKNNQ